MFHIMILMVTISAIQNSCLAEQKTVCPKLDQAYIECGDFNLGALITVYENGKTGKCKSGVILDRRMQYIEAIAFAVKTVNNNSDLMGNFSLGFVILNDCGGEGSSSNKVISFLPCKQDHSESCCNESIPNVVGTIGPLSSSQAVVLSPILGHNGIVQISPMATSDELSEKDKYPYFMRTIPPDQFQVKAIVNILLHFNWTYVSLLYENNKYGVSNFINFKSEIRNQGICIAYEEGVSENWNINSSDYTSIARGLLRNSKARVIVAFILPQSAQGILTGLKELKSTVKYIWLGSETFDKRAVQGYEDTLVGSLHLSGQPGLPDPKFPTYFSSLSPSNNFKNPWYKEFWAHSFQCEWKNNSSPLCTANSTLPCKKSCDSFQNVSDIENFFHDSTWTYSFIDIVYVFADAINRAIKFCNSSSIHNGGEYNKQDIIDCVHGKTLLRELKNTSYDGRTKHIEFDKNYDIYGSYNIQQLVKYGDDYIFQNVGYWDRKINTIVINNEPLLQWDKDVHVHNEAATEHIENVHPFYVSTEPKLNFYTPKTIPESVCSKPCDKGEGTLVNEVNPKCCWNCIKCAVNEFVNDTRCTACAIRTWPNINRTGCYDIELYYLQWNELPGYILLILVIVAIVLLTIATVIFIVFRDQKIIKASTPKLMLVTLTGLYIALIGCLLFLLKPTQISCVLLITFFHISFTMLYSPLLARTLRIYRVFSGSARLTTKIAFVSESCMFVLVSLCITLQGCILLGLLIHDAPHPDVIMPDFLKELVILYCDTNVFCLCLPLGYNILLLLCCTALGFLTRKLPENYNESLYIFFSSSTTIIVWLAFLPTYFLTNNATYRELLLPAAALLNVYTMLVGLLFPRIYVVIMAHHRAKRTQSRRKSEWTRSTIVLSITSQCGSNENMNMLKTRPISRSISSCERCYRCNSVVNSRTASNRSINDTYSSDDEIINTKM